MKKLLISMIIILLVLPLNMVSATTLQPDANIKVYIEGEQVHFDVNPIVINGTTVVQFTPIFKRLGIEYKWMDNEKMIIGYKDDREIRLKIDSPVVSVNDNNIKLSASPILFANKTFVPLRFIGESTGLIVDWNKETKEVHINKGTQTKDYVHPDVLAHTFGLDFNATDLDFLRAVKIEPDQFAANVYSFFSYKKFGYEGELHALIAPDSDQLRSISYEYFSKQLNSSIIKVYRDVIKELENTYGPPNEFQIMKNTGDSWIDVNADMTDQELLRNVRNQTHYAYANWNLSKVNISVLFTHDGNDVMVGVQFTPPL